MRTINLKNESLIYYVFIWIRSQILTWQWYTYPGGRGRVQLLRRRSSRPRLWPPSGTWAWSSRCSSMSSRSQVRHPQGPSCVPWLYARLRPSSGSLSSFSRKSNEHVFFFKFFSKLFEIQNNFSNFFFSRNKESSVNVDCSFTLVRPYNLIY